MELKPLIVGAAVVAVVALAVLIWSILQMQRPPGIVGKTAYSLILVLVAGLLLREVVTVWEPRKTGIGALHVSAGGDADTVRGEAIRAMIVQRYDRINATFKRENQRRRALLDQESGLEGLEASALPFSEASLGFSSDQLDQLELTVQGVNFGQILSGIRRRVAPPNEITGHIVQSGEDKDISAVIRWPGAPLFDTLPNETNKLMTFENIARDSELANEVACSLIWAQVVPQTDKKVANMRRGQYCIWVRGFLLWVGAFERKQAGLPPKPEEEREIESSLEDLQLLIKQDVDFPEVYLLKADLIALRGLSPTNLRREAEEARIIYARLGQGDTLSEARELASNLRVAAAGPVIAAATATTGESPAVAALRPIVDVASGTPIYFPDSRFGEAMRAKADAIAQTSRATGFIIDANLQQVYSGTAFVVGIDLVAAADFSVGVGPSGAQTRNKAPIFFGIGDQVPEDGAGGFEVTEIIQFGNDGNLVLLRVPGLAAGGAVPAPLPETAEARPGTPVAVIGFPAFDLRAPDSVNEQVTDPLHQKRLALGEISGSSGEGQIGHDAATTGGMSGAPILNLLTGEVIGLHVGGLWKDTGKENTGVPISNEIISSILSE